VYAVGADLTVLHWDGKEWTAVDTGADVPDGTPYNAVWGAEGHLFVVGGDGVVLHKFEETWKKEDSAVTYDLKSIWGASLVDIYVGAAGGIILRRIGGAWTSVPVAGGAVSMNTVFGLTGALMWAGGSQSTVVVYEDVAWVPAMTNDVSARSLNAGWAFGEKDVWFIGDNGALIQRQAGKWNLAPVAGPYFKNHTFYGLWGRSIVPDGDAGDSQQEALAVGEKGAMLRYDGTDWTDMEGAPTVDITDIDGLSDSDMLAVGSDGLLLAWDGAAWRGLARVTAPAAEGDEPGNEGTAGKDITGVAAADGVYADDGYVAVAADGSIVRVFDGAVAIEDKAVAGKLFGVCVAADTVAAVGDKGGVYLEDQSGEWKKVPTGLFDTLRDCAVDEAGNVYAVGDSGRIIVVENGIGKTLDAPTISNLTRADLWDGKLYVVGDNGLLLRYGETSGFEKLHQEPGLFLYGVAAFEDRVVAVGWGARVLVWRPDSETIEKFDVEGAGVLLQVFGADASHQFVVGKKGRMVEYIKAGGSK